MLRNPEPEREALYRIRKVNDDLYNVDSWQWGRRLWLPYIIGSKTAEEAQAKIETWCLKVRRTK
jgi:hypothetical protein